MCGVKHDSVETVRDALVLERERLMSLLQNISYLSPYPSEANFILCRVKNRDAQDLQSRLANEEGIIVRYYSSPMELAGCIRISVGKPHQTDRLISALKRMQLV